MFGFAWLTLRQAQQALRNGRLEEAQRLLEQPAARSHRKAGELLVDLARAFAERGERNLRKDDTEAAWADLLQAEQLGTAHKASERLRQALTSLALAQLRALIQTADLDRAEGTVVRMRQRNVNSLELGTLEEGLRDWLRARELAGRGEFALAVELAAQASRLLGINSRLEAFHTELLRHQQTFPELLARLHEAASNERWQEVVERAEQVLAAAPVHPEARALRTRAWRALEPTSTALPDGDDEKGPADLAFRFFLWIDGVGGYLVCLANRVTFGQALPGARVDVPLVADVSRLHATLTRDGEGYLLEAVRPIQVNGATVTRALLQPGDRVTIGASCQFLFRLPMAANTSARLELVSGHRLPVAVDGVLLMAETLVLAAGAQAHVSIPGLKKPMVLFRHRDGLGLRVQAEVRVNGQPVSGRTILPACATVSGEDVSFAIEPAE